MEYFHIYYLAIFFLILKTTFSKIIWYGNWAYSCDFPKNDLVNVTSTQEACTGLCEKTLGCTHYTWSRTVDGNFCFMKKGSVTKENANNTKTLNMICGFLDSEKLNWTENWATGCDFLNNDLKYVKIRKEDCSDVCEKTVGCTHYTWKSHWYNGEICYMKKGAVTKNDAFKTYDHDMICGILPSVNIEALKSKILWSDEFDSQIAFQKNWIQETEGYDWRNNYLYTNLSNNRNFEISGGMLTIHTRKDQFEDEQFSSTQLISSRSFKYGIFEMRANLPYGRGIWPEFWLLDADKPLSCPQDDKNEDISCGMNLTNCTIYCKTYKQIITTQINESKQLNDVSNQFHLYQLYWEKYSIKGFIDNRIYFSYDRPANSNYKNWPFDDDFNITLNTKVDRDLRDALGFNENIFPQRYIIDYVRQYSIKPKKQENQKNEAVLNKFPIFLLIFIKFLINL